MKKVFIILLVVFCSCQSKLKYLNKYDGYKGQPEKVEVLSYDISLKDSTIPTNFSGKYELIYDTEGRRIKQLNYKPDGTQKHGGWYYDYDRYGNRIMVKLLFKEGQINVLNNYEFNKKGFQIKGTYYTTNGKEGASKSIFDNKTKTEKIFRKKKDEDYKQDGLKIYNDQWQLLESISLDNSGKRRSGYKFSYDDNGNQETVEIYRPYDKLIGIIKTKFNKQCQPLVKTRYEVDENNTITEKSRTTYQYKYDEMGNVIEERFTINGILEIVNIFNYQYR